MLAIKPNSLDCVLKVTNKEIGTAFKEWAIVCDALGKGQQSIIFRKGGIHEDKYDDVAESDGAIMEALLHTRIDVDGPAGLAAAAVGHVEHPSLLLLLSIDVTIIIMGLKAIL